MRKASRQRRTLRQRYAQLTFWNKAAFFGSVASIVGLAIAFMPFLVERLSPDTGAHDPRSSQLRPFLVIEPARQPDSSLKQIVLRTKNTGPVPARLLYLSGMTLIDDAPLRTSIDEKDDQVVYPGEVVVLSHVNLDHPEEIERGTRRLVIGFAALYEAAGSPGDQRWITFSTFEYDRNLRKLIILRRDEEGVSPETDRCSVQRYLPQNQ